MGDVQTVVLVPSRYEEWARRFTEVAVVIEPLVPRGVVEHIGSTSVPGPSAGAASDSQFEDREPPTPDP